MEVPADAYCLQLGYKCVVRKGSDGEYGSCMYPDGTECVSWDFYRGSCGQQYSFCEQQGGRIENRIENMGTWTAEYAVCLFSDASECGEEEYAAGRCKPSECRKWQLSQDGCVR